MIVTREYDDPSMTTRVAFAITDHELAHMPRWLMHQFQEAMRLLSRVATWAEEHEEKPQRLTSCGHDDCEAVAQYEAKHGPIESLKFTRRANA